MNLWIKLVFFGTCSLNSYPSGSWGELDYGLAWLSNLRSTEMQLCLEDKLANAAKALNVYELQDLIAIEKPSAKELTWALTCCVMNADANEESDKQASRFVILEKLLAAGANVNGKIYSLPPIVYCAENFPYPELTLFLLKKGSKITYQLKFCSESKCIDKVNNKITEKLESQAAAIRKADKHMCNFYANLLKRFYTIRDILIAHQEKLERIKKLGEIDCLKKYICKHMIMNPELYAKHDFSELPKDLYDEMVELEIIRNQNN